MKELNEFSLSPSQIGRLYHNKKIDIKENDQIFTIEFISEKEGKIEKNNDTSYNNKFERESELFVKCIENTKKYKGIVFEGGDSKDDMEITSWTAFK